MEKSILNYISMKVQNKFTSHPEKYLQQKNTQI